MFFVYNIIFDSIHGEHSKMTNLKHSLWVEKYRPSTLEDYIFSNPTYKAQVLKMIQERSIPHILMSGTRGSGKSSLCFLLIKELDIDWSDVKIINASEENSVDTVRDKIKKFVQTAPTGPFKIVLLEEADYMSANGQAALRRIMEEYSDTARFLINCNYLHKVIPEIQSRCTIKFKFESMDKNDIAEYLIKILSNEKIAVDLDVLDYFIDAGYPDIRSIVGSVYQYSTDGKLKLPPVSTHIDDYKLTLISLLTQDKWTDARKLVCSSVSNNEYEELYRFLYENIHLSAKFKNQELWEEAIIVIAEHLYKHQAVADAEINAAAMFIKLSQLN